ncbi:pilus assembly protein PilW [Vibrio sinaloensis]|nr:pilus assembly protein PilW [Vibrio sinaloensis]
MRLASHNTQYGSSLIEILVASLMGVMTLGVVGSILLASLQITEHRGERLLLVDSIESVMLHIKQDIRRAGFNDARGVSVRLVGSTKTIYVSPASQQLGYVYRAASSVEGPFRNAFFKYYVSTTSSVGQLKICEKHTSAPLDIASAAESGLLGNCYNLFDPKLISVSEFEVSTEVTSEHARASQLVSVRLAGQLTQAPEVNYSSQITVRVRND